MDFSALHAAMRRWVERDILAGVSSAVLVGSEVVDLHCEGKADREAGIALREDHVFRLFSNTKLATSIAVLMLVEEGRLALDAPVGEWLPQLARPVVLRPGAQRLDDTEPALRPITVRHLLSHSSGLAYGLLDPGTMMYRAYERAELRHPQTTLADLVERVAALPLLYHPGTGWEYSVATDVLARLVEVVSGQRFGDFLQARVFGPLGMVDTGFHVPADRHSRLAALYVGASPVDPLAPGLARADDVPYPGAYLRAVPQQSGGGGLVGTLPDMIALLRSLLPGGPRLLRDETIAQMMRNQLADGVSVGFPGTPRVAGKGFGLGGAVTLQPSRIDPPGAVGEFQWGGMAGTHWWIWPERNIAGVVMTQRFLGFWNPFSFELKRLMCSGAGVT